MLANDNTGSWFAATPEHCQTDFAMYDAALRQALTQSRVGISDTDYKEVLYESSGYQMIWKLAYLAQHPRLIDSPIDISFPHQKGSESLVAYAARWRHVLHISYIRGIFYSDRYFAETFVSNLHSVFDSTMKLAMLTLIRRIAVNRPLPHYMSPENIVTYMCSHFSRIGVRGILPLHTPREILATRKGSPRPWSSVPVRSLDHGASSESADSPDSFFDIRQLDGISDATMLAICSLMAAGPRTCDFCQSTDHLIANCPRLRTADPRSLSRIVNAIQSARSSGGGSPNFSTSSRPSSSSGRSNSTQRPQTPPTSNRSTRAVRQLEADDTDTDVSHAPLTDDEESDGPDF
jgi:hypothetical protein